jgi:hypothetical protein
MVYQSSNSKVPIPLIRQAWQAGRRDSKSLLGPDCAHISALQMWHWLHLIFKPTVILYVGIWLCLKIWFTMVYPWYPLFLASFWKGTWSSTIRFRGMVYKFYFQTDPYSMAISGTYINWRYLVPIPYVRPKLSGNIPTIHMANKMCPAAMAGSPPSIMSSWCLGWCSDLVGTVVLDESPVTTAWKPPLFRDI